MDLVCLRAPVTREQIRVDLPALFVLRDPAEDILKLGPFINAAGLAGGEEGVDNGGSLGGIVIAAEQIVLPSDSCAEKGFFVTIGAENPDIFLQDYRARSACLLGRVCF